MDNENIYELLENESIEYQIYTMDKLISRRNLLIFSLPDEAKDVYEILISKHRAKRDELLKSLDVDNINWDKIKIIQSLESYECVQVWEAGFKRLFNKFNIPKS